MGAVRAPSRPLTAARRMVRPDDRPARPRARQLAVRALPGPGGRPLPVQRQRLGACRSEAAPPSRAHSRTLERLAVGLFGVDVQGTVTVGPLVTDWESVPEPLTCGPANECKPARDRRRPTSAQPRQFRERAAGRTVRARTPRPAVPTRVEPPSRAARSPSTPGRSSSIFLTTPRRRASRRVALRPGRAAQVEMRFWFR
jgi:hypothetical protein